MTLRTQMIQTEEFGIQIQIEILYRLYKYEYIIFITTHAI
jgi:hypothetical protein